MEDNIKIKQTIKNIIGRTLIKQYSIPEIQKHLKPDDNYLSVFVQDIFINDNSIISSFQFDLKDKKIYFNSDVITEKSNWDILNRILYIYFKENINRPIDISFDLIINII